MSPGKNFQYEFRWNWPNESIILLYLRVVALAALEQEKADLLERKAVKPNRLKLYISYWLGNSHSVLQIILYNSIFHSLR